jgi:hypothetical protein
MKIHSPFSKSSANIPARQLQQAQAQAQAHSIIDHDRWRTRLRDADEGDDLVCTDVEAPQVIFIHSSFGARSI